MKDFVSSIPGIIAGLIGFSFVLTTITEWAYHYSIGSNFIHLNTPADLASLSLLYMPAIGISLFAGAVSTLLLSRLPAYVFPTLLIAFIIYAILQNSKSTELPYVAPKEVIWVAVWYLIWPPFSSWLFRQIPLFNKLPSGRFDVLHGTVHLISLLVVCFLMIGVMRARSDLSFTRGDYRVIYDNAVVEDNIRLLKATTKGILTPMLQKFPVEVVMR